MCPSRLLADSRVILAVAILSSGCGTASTSKYLHPNADLGALKKVAVLPLENLSADRAAGEKVTKLLLIEVLQLDVFQVIEPGLVAKALRADRVESAETLAPPDLKKLGQTLGADAFFIGSVVDYAETRTGTTPTPEVTIQLRLVETQTGATVWSGSRTRSGAKVATRLFGVGGQSLTQAARQVLRQELQTLLE